MQLPGLALGSNCFQKLVHLKNLVLMELSLPKDGEDVMRLPTSMSCLTALEHLTIEEPGKPCPALHRNSQAKYN